MSGKITQIESDVVDGAYVDTWWDGQSRNWITQLKTPSGFQIGDAMFAANKEGAEVSHRFMVNEANDRIEDYTGIL